MNKVKKNIFVIMIVLVLLAIFFVATRDYDKFKLLDRSMNSELDNQTLEIVSATKLCNQIDEIYRESCYKGIGYSIGYNGDENISKCDILEEPARLACYHSTGRFLGEKYDNFELIAQICNDVESSSDIHIEQCKSRSVAALAKKYAKNIKYAKEFCATLEGRSYEGQCFKGIGEGISQYHFQKDYTSLNLCDNLSRINACKFGYAYQIIKTQEKTPDEILNLTDLLKWPDFTIRLIYYWGYINSKNKGRESALRLCNQFSNLTYNEECYKGAYAV